MSWDSLCDLALMSIELKETKKTNFDEIIDKFASIKSRKALFYHVFIETKKARLIDFCCSMFVILHNKNT